VGLEALFKGWTGELKTKFINGLFFDKQYRIFNNIIIQTERGSTQIDHVIVSKYGLFAIETKDKTGWIFGDPDQERWTQVIYKKSSLFRIP
jgi:restriction system protein